LYLAALLILQANLLIANAAEPSSTDQIIIEGDTLENMLDRKLKASGNAVLKKGGTAIKADIIEYDQISEDLYARGDVRLEMPGSNITGTELELSMNSNTGAIPNATFITEINNSSPSSFNKRLRGTATTFFLEGKDKKRLQNASITTCEEGQNDWFIKATELEINGRSDKINASNALLEFKGIPILYSPLVNFSFNDQRKSGFLTPSIGSTTKSGFETAAPYYINLSPTSDATITPRYLSKRGIQLQGEYRYLNEDYSGDSSVEILNDSVSQESNRYLYKVKHEHKLSEGLVGKVNYEKVSDNDYFSDLESLVSVTSQVSLPQELSLEYKKDDWDINFIAQKFQNLTSSSPYERMPSLSLRRSLFSEGMDGINSYETNFNMSITQFDRDSNYSGSAKEKGSRFIARPSLAIPFEKSYGYIKPKITINLASYNLDNASVSSKELSIPTLSVDSGLYADRQFKFLENEFTQTLEPRIFYAYTPYRNQSMLPMFDTALLDLNQNTLFSSNQFAGGDRVMDTNQFTLAATSRFIDQNGTERLSGTLAQRFYLNKRKVLNEAQYINSVYQSDSSDLFMLAFARLNKALTINTEIQYNPDESSTNRATFSSKYFPQPGKLIDASYRLIRSAGTTDYDTKQINLAGQWPIGSGYSTIGRYNYDIKESSVAEALVGLEYDAGCWSASVLLHRLSLATSDKPNDTLFFQLQLGGLGSLGTSKASLDEVLYRNVQGALGANDLPDKYREENFN
jgi:LPS-assembly protein